MRDTDILSLESQVKLIASRYHARCPARVQLCDLVHAGWLGAIQAVDRFDSSRGVILSTYAERKIRSAILDYMRGEDFLSRQHRREVKAGEKEPFTFSALENDAVDTHWRSRYKAIEDLIALQTLLNRADLKSRTILFLHRYFSLEKTQAEIAAEAGISEGRVSQIIRLALVKLRAAA